MNNYTTIANNKTIKRQVNVSSVFIVFCCLFFFCLFFASNSFAQSCTADENNNTTSTFQIPTNNFISSSIEAVQNKLTYMNVQLYSNIFNNSNYKEAITSLITVSIAIYGILFMTGMVQAKFQDFIMRVIKIGAVSMLTFTDSALLFNNILVQFFHQGTEEIIGYFADGGITTFLASKFDTAAKALEPGNTLGGLDTLADKLFSAKFFMTVLAMLTSNYGPITFVITLIAVYYTIKSLISALWVYVMSLIVRTLLLGLAPIFIPTILFQRTRHIFIGWINQIVNSCIQPIMLFMFFMFFAKLTEACLDSLMQIPACFNSLPEASRGTAQSMTFWQFMRLDNLTGKWKPNTMSWTTTENSPEPFLIIFSFLIIANLADRFNSIILQIAGKISQTGTNLTTGNPLYVAKNMITSNSRAVSKA